LIWASISWIRPPSPRPCPGSIPRAGLAAVRNDLPRPLGPSSSCFLHPARRGDYVRSSLRPTPEKREVRAKSLDVLELLPPSTASNHAVDTPTTCSRAVTSRTRMYSALCVLLTATQQAPPRRRRCCGCEALEHSRSRFCTTMDVASRTLTMSTYRPTLAQALMSAINMPWSSTGSGRSCGACACDSHCRRAAKRPFPA